MTNRRARSWVAIGFSTLIFTLIVWAGPGAESAEKEAIPQTTRVPAGYFISGSDRDEREAAYKLDEQAYGHRITRTQGWYERERPRDRRTTGAFVISNTPITNSQYAAFVKATGYRPPNVDAATWVSYRLAHPFQRTRRFAWRKSTPPPGRESHPVVLVDHRDAVAYATWLAKETGKPWRLPTELEWEKAMRGLDGRKFPWGEDFNAKKLNSHDLGPFDTVPVGTFSDGASPFGLLDAAGQVFEWTATPTKAGTAAPRRYFVKGGSWDDKGCGVCRPAARHGRPSDLRHILIGFRVVHNVAQ